jgi:uncharacterized membrane protein YhaH (DUF805 family)
MSFIDAAKSGFIKYVDFKGRSSRSEYWYFVLALGLIAILIAFVEISTGMIDSIDSQGPLSIIFSAITILPSLSVAARRLHDRGHSGWNQLWILTIIGIIPILIMLMLPAKEDENKWGMNPLLNSYN